MQADAMTKGSAFDIAGNNAALSSTNGFFRIRNIATPTTANGLFFRVHPTPSGGNGLTIINDGKVGIGTALPTEALDVSGNLKFSQALMPNNLPGTAGQILVSAGAGAPPTWSNSASALGVPISSLLSATQANTTLIDNLNYAQKWKWSTLAAFATGFQLDFPAITSGKGLYITSTNASQTGKLVEISHAGQTGAALKITVGTTTGGESAVLNPSPGIEFIASNVTTGTGMQLLASNAGLNSTRGFFRVANTALTPTTATGLFTRIEPNGTVGSGLTVINDGKVGVGTTTPNSTLQVNGSVAAKIRPFTGTLLVSDNDYTIIATGDVTLPDATQCSGRLLNIVKGTASGTDITITATPNFQKETSTFNTYGLNSGVKTIQVQSDGNVWFILSITNF